MSTCTPNIFAYHLRLCHSRVLLTNTFILLKAICFARTHTATHPRPFTYPFHVLRPIALNTGTLASVLTVNSGASISFLIDSSTPLARGRTQRKTRASWSSARCGVIIKPRYMQARMRGPPARTKSSEEKKDTLVRDSANFNPTRVNIAALRMPLNF
jgi:hypothetical protein